jgi:predicted lipoprotein with Yx(FWY)xxD motif
MKRTLACGAIALATALLSAGCSMMPDKGSTSASAPAKSMDGVLVGPNGMTLYTFDRDTAGTGKSACNGPCAANWPPLMAGADAKASGAWSVITRDDGAKQWAYQGRPLYYWAKDQKPGDKTGDGVNNVWKTARP